MADTRKRKTDNIDTIENTVAAELSENDNLVEYIQPSSLDILKARYAAIEEDEQIRNEGFELAKKSGLIKKQRPESTVFGYYTSTNIKDEIRTDVDSPLSRVFDTTRSEFDADNVSFSDIGFEQAKKDKEAEIISVEAEPEKPKKKRTSKAVAETEVVAEVEKPKRTRTTKATADTKAEAEAEKPKRTRTTKAAAEAKDEAEAEKPKRTRATKAAAEANVEAEAEKPKRTRTTKAAAEAKTEAEAEKPKRTRTTKAAAETKVEAEVEKPKRTRTTKKAEEVAEIQQENTPTEAESEKEDKPVILNRYGFDTHTRVIYFDESADDGIKRNSEDEVSSLFSVNDTGKKRRRFPWSTRKK